jgi:putative mRNA 3-end processing factor
MTLLHIAERGLYCEAGDFTSTRGTVARAVITRTATTRGGGSSATHARAKAKGCCELGRPEASIRALEWGEAVDMNGVRVSLHPAGHILGSAQIRVEYHGEVWVASGDYKTDPDPTCTPFELVRCDTFITESTFGLPIYRWTPEAQVFAEIRAWWMANREAGRASLLFAYALGKAQRLLGLAVDIGPIYTHGPSD